MKNDCVVYFRINEHYWVSLLEVAPTTRAFIRFPASLTSSPLGTSTISRSELQNIVGEVALEHDKPGTADISDYLFLREEMLVAWVPKQLWNTDAERLSVLEIDRFHQLCLARVETFRSGQKQKLSNALIDDKSDVLQKSTALMEFIGAQHFSIWIWCRESRFFVLREASYEAKRKGVHEDDQDSAIAGVFRTDVAFHESAFEHKATNAAALGGMNTVTRIRVPLALDDGAQKSGALFSFYSPEKDFFLRPEQRAFIEHCARTIMAEEAALFAGQFSRTVTALLDGYRSGQLQEFLNKACRTIAQHASFEAVSIFKTDDQERPKKLILAAIKEHGERPAGSDISYDLAGPRLTSRVFKSKKLICSYAIRAEEHNGDIFEEQTEAPAENWIGLPILRQGAQPVGVLRAMNRFKYERKSGETVKRIVPLNDYDIRLLKHCAEVIAYVEEVERANQERQKSQQLDNNRLRDFITTFRHELKSPLNLVTNVRSRLSWALIKDDLMTDTTSLPKYIDLFCQDTEAVGDRMLFIVNSLTLEPQDLVRKKKYCHCFKEIAAPIMRFAKIEAANKRKDLHFDIQSLSKDVYCDPLAASIALHALVDNAIKYAIKGSPINIFGTAEPEFFTIHVSNVGHPIPENEQALIFKKYERGSYARDQAIEGAGIGLWLAAEIMRENNGRVTLLHGGESPIVFTVKIGYRPSFPMA